MTRFYSSTAQPTTLSASCTNSATSIQVTATTGFPAVEFILALDYGGAAQELVKVTNVAGTTLTVTRGFDSTTAQAHSLGAAVQHVHSADDFRLSRTHEGASTGIHGATGAVVGTTDAQALSNKDLSSGTNTFPASVVTTTGTQTLTNKTVALGSNTVSGTLAQFNTAVTDADLASLAGTETLTNKTVNLSSNTLSGTTAQFNTALSDNDFATLAGTETLTNKTITGLGGSSNLTGDFIGGTRYISKPSDQTVASNTTYQNDSALTFTVTANAVYAIEYYFNQTNTTVGGAKAQIVFPAGATWRPSPVTGTASPLAVTSGNTGSNNTLNLNVSVPQILAVGATPGSVTLQFAQDVSDASGTVMKANSFFLVRRVA